MKKLILVSALGLIVSAQAFAAGTEIKDSTISNTAVIEDSTNTAEKQSEANMGSIKIEKGNIAVKDSEILNDAAIKNSDNYSAPHSKANMGSVVVD
ncbi:MAG: hypothetical protein KAH20_06510 [Methylococcales bacterium]|nr:hypothetical protein [Methylococcales bacterium]